MRIHPIEKNHDDLQGWGYDAYRVGDAEALTLSSEALGNSRNRSYFLGD